MGFTTFPRNQDATVKLKSEIISIKLFFNTFALPKDLWIYGPNTQIAKYIVGGGLKNPYTFTDTQYFLDF